MVEGGLLFSAYLGRGTGAEGTGEGGERGRGRRHARAMWGVFYSAGFWLHLLLYLCCVCVSNGTLYLSFPLLSYIFVCLREYKGNKKNGLGAVRAVGVRKGGVDMSWGVTVLYVRDLECVVIFSLSLLGRVVGVGFLWFVWFLWN